MTVHPLMFLVQIEIFFLSTLHIFDEKKNQQLLPFPDNHPSIEIAFHFLDRFFLPIWLFEEISLG